MQWKFLDLVLQHLGFNDTIKRCLKSIYNSPVAQIRINGSLSCLYADDILVTLSDPNTSLPKLMTCLDQYGSYLGYKLNTEKTQTLSFNYLLQEHF